MFGEKNFSRERSFDEKKRAYFTRLAMSVRQELRLHKEQGLWKRVRQHKDGRDVSSRDWGNVSEHCLVEVARVLEFAKILKLNKTSADNLVRAAALHDFFKKSEKDIVKSKGLKRSSFDEASEQADQVMQAAGIEESVVALVNAVADSALPETEVILQKKELTDDDIAFLVMHYVDDYTIDSNWVVSKDTQGNRLINDLDRRMDKNEANPRYQELNQGGRLVFDEFGKKVVSKSETAYQAQRRIGHIIEEKLSELMRSRSGIQVNPLDLPEYIDSQVKTAIEKVF